MYLLCSHRAHFPLNSPGFYPADSSKTARRLWDGPRPFPDPGQTREEVHARAQLPAMLETMEVADMEGTPL